MAAKIITQTFEAGSSITVHPMFVGVLPRGITRRTTYKVTRVYSTGRSWRVVFTDRAGFVRDLPIAMFVDTTPAWVDGWTIRLDMTGSHKNPGFVRRYVRRYVRA